MKNERKQVGRKLLIPFLAVITVLTSILWLMPAACADTAITQNTGTVAARAAAEERGCEVVWNNEDRSITLVKEDRSVRFRIDRRFVEYMIDGVSSYDFCDPAPEITGGTAYVPARLIDNAFSADSAAKIAPFYSMTIANVSSGGTIAGTTALRAALPSPLPTGTAQIRYYLIDPETGSGFVIARGSDAAASYNWLPRSRDNGDKVLAAVLSDSSGRFLAGCTKPVTVELAPTVVLKGLTGGQTVSGTASLSANLNFSAAYVTYKITNTASGKTVETTVQDPAGTYAWAPGAAYNGSVTVQAVAYDEKKQSFASPPVSVTVAVQPKLTLSGVKAGQTVNGPVTLTAVRNFDVLDTEYVSRDSKTGAEQSLKKFSYGSYTWFPGWSSGGNKELFVRVTGTDGTVYTSTPIAVSVSGTAKLLLLGAGPDQVITAASPAKLSASCNVTLTGLKYIMTNTATGVQKTLATLTNVPGDFTYTPVSGDGGTWKLKAVGTYGNGGTLSSEAVKVTVYTGTLYPPVAIVEKSEFQSMASKLAVADANVSGMSASLQTAQAILESGWGQSVPVDKYKGNVSYNLFGIKGSGSAGSVVSNTWEEYNGVKYRIDAKFRAYKSVSESWADHNRLLMNADRYEPYRKVMYDSTLGAWALKRCGYATDSKYPVKLIDLIEQYGLEELDRVAI